MSSQKVSFNISVVDLGKIELLVDKGVYTNKTDFITKALVHELAKNEEVIEQAKNHKNWGIGIVYLNQEEINKYIEDHKKVDIFVIGMLVIDKKIPLEDMQAAIKTLKVYGKVVAEREIKSYYL